MKQIISCLAIGTCLLVAPTGTVFGANPSGTGQPNQSCQSVFPAGTFTPPGFNTDGFNHATNVYAGSGQNTQTPANSHAVSQYDVACFQAGQH